MRLGERKRDAKIVAFFALLLPALFGVLGLVVDGGIMLATHRQAQSAADAGALAAARDLLAGNPSTMSTTAIALTGAFSNLSSAAVQVNSPPAAGNYAGKSKYVEVIVTVPVSTYLIQVLTNESTYVVSARAVAGIECFAPHELISCLAPTAVPGLSIDGIALQVNGLIAVNSQGSGVDQNNVAINYGLPASAVTLPNGGTLCSTNLRVVGGVANAGNITAFTTANPALSARLLPRTDPYLALPTPTTSTGLVAIYPSPDGTNRTAPADFSLRLDAGQSFTLSPGIYASIEITGVGPGTVTFQPGIYVLQGGNAAGHALSINTGGTIVADGVLFYNTGTSFDVTTGVPDCNDSNTLGMEPGATFGSVQIKAANITLTGLADTSNLLQGMVYYQRRWNTQSVSICSGTSSTTISGTIYARWAPVSLTMSGNWQGQVAVGSLQMNGLTMNNAVSMSRGTTYAKSPQVFLVE